MKFAIRLLSYVLFGAFFSVVAVAEPPHLALELNKAETTANGCRLTFRIANYFPARLDDVNIEIYFVDGKGVVIQSVQFPFATVLAGRTRFAKFDVRDTTCEAIGGMFVNEFKSCKGETDMSATCLDTLAISNLTALKFSGGMP